MSEPMMKDESGADTRRETIVTSGDLQAYVPKAPDGGYGWVILAAAFGFTTLLDGIAFTFGVFLPTFEEHFEATNAQVSLVGALLIGVYLGAGVVAAPLTNYYGARPVAMCGSVIASAAFILSTFAPNLWSFTLIYGLVGGLGLGQLFLPPVVTVAFYFEKRRALATGITMCGSGIGTFIFAPISSYLIEQMGWKNALIILAGFLLNGVVLGALLKPLVPEYQKEPMKSLRQRPPSIHVTTSEGEHVTLLTSRGVEEEDINTSDQNNCKSSPPASVKPSQMNAYTGSMHLVLSSHNVRSSRTLGNGSEQVLDTAALSKPLFRKDIFLSNISLSKRNLQKSHDQSTTFAKSVVTLEDEHCKCCPPVVRNTLGILLDFSTIKNPSVLIVYISNFLVCAGMHAPYMYLTDYALDGGVKVMLAAALISIIGATNTCGRLVAGALNNHPRVDPFQLYMYALILGGVAQSLMPFVEAYWLMAILGALFGFCFAMSVPTLPILLLDIVGLDHLTKTYGIATLVGGVSSCVGPPILGALYDSTSNYAASFLTSGAMFAASGLIMAVFYFPKFKYSRSSRQKVNKKDAL